MLFQSAQDILRDADVKLAIAILNDVDAIESLAFGGNLVAGAGFEPATFRL